MPAFSEETMIPLSEVKIGQRAQVQRMSADDAVNQRLLAFGLMPGAEVRVVHVAPLGDPIAIAFCSQEVMIRRADARSVLVEPLAQ